MQVLNQIHQVTLAREWVDTTKSKTFGGGIVKTTRVVEELVQAVVVEAMRVLKTLQHLDSIPMRDELVAILVELSSAFPDIRESRILLNVWNQLEGNLVAPFAK